MSHTRTCALTVALLLVAVLSSGCAPTKLVFVPSTEPVQAAEPFQVKVVLCLDGVETVSSQAVEFPAGVWIVSEPGPPE